MLSTIITYTIAPVVVTIVGGIIAAYRAPGEKTRIAVQHFAAGVVFAAVSVELIPELGKDAGLLPMVLGFLIGVLVMLAMRYATGKLEQSGSKEGSKGTGSLIVATGMDIFIDGLLMGVSFSVGVTEGLIIAIALTIELVFLVISVVSSIAKMGKAKSYIIGLSFMFGLLVLLGACIGGFFLGGLSGAGLEVVIAFAAAALLYLVTEELLVEAHEGKDNAFATTMFFVGFLIILVLERVVSKG